VEDLAAGAAAQKIVEGLAVVVKMAGMVAAQ